MIVYKATSKTTGKSYIGKTINTLKQRRNEHLRSSKTSRHTHHFYNAIKKYGNDDFEWVILDTAKNEEELNLLEIKYISEHNTYTSGYNMSLGGEGQSGYKYTKEHSEKMSASLKTAYEDGRRTPVFDNLSNDSIKNIRAGASKWSKENTIGSKNPMWCKGKQILIDDIPYNCMREAANELKVHIKTIQYRLNSTNFSNYIRCI